MKPGKKMLAMIGAILVSLILLAIFGAGEQIKGIGQMRYGIDIRGGVEAVFEAEGVDKVPSAEELETAREVLSMRLDSLNITDREVTIDKENGYIIVRFPWKSDEKDFRPEEAIEELGEMAKLTFCDENMNVLLDGSDIDGSTAQRDNSDMGQGYVVALQFTDDGAKQFEQITGDLIGQTLGIYMDGELISNPMVESQISGGQAVISGLESYEEASALSDKINAGALPFSLKTTSFSTISPSMGDGALKVMICSGIIAFLAVCVFMIVVYRLPGVVACISLLLQMIVQLLAVSIPQYTLTLPGIAGVILSLGMAVDANVIIAERIMEELDKGYSVRTSIKNGYKNAFSSVLDGNVTTAVVAVILMIFGSGSMLSFGYTLLVGMILNLIAGVTVSKQLLLSLILLPGWNNEKWFRKKKVLRIRQFYKRKWICVIISSTIFLIGIFACLSKGVKLDTQFTGGVVLNYTVTGTMELEKIASEVEQVTERAVTAQKVEHNTIGENRLELTLAGNGGMTTEELRQITQAVERTVGEGNAALESNYAVEPYIGEKALKNAATAVGLSLIFILLYVAFRFAVISGGAAGVTALMALAHDVLVVFFAFVIAQIPLNDAFVAVILTIIGYSINDTIVVYDRIRENRKDSVQPDIIELTDRSISQVLSRSVNSSITTGICVLVILIAAIFYRIDSIWEFALPMFFGLLSGCYSSICIASTLWAMWEKHKIHFRRKEEIEESLRA